MTRKLFIVLLAYIMTTMVVSAQDKNVTYIEKQGDGASRVFAVSFPVDMGQKKLKKTEDMKDEANRQVIDAILFKGVENYNNGQPLIVDSNNTFARSIVNPDKRLYSGYCKETHMENLDAKTFCHFVVVVNHFNLLRVLKLRGAMTQDFVE